jgi:hypothetical protein
VADYVLLVGFVSLLLSGEYSPPVGFVVLLLG